MKTIGIRELKRALARLATEGHLRIAERPRFHYPRSPARAPSGTAQRLIDEDRGERSYQEKYEQRK